MKKMLNEIRVTRARVHNLKDVSLSIPKNELSVITGPSGSGKSSLAFDTIYVEGQRRYIESLSSYARQFLGQFQPPDVESIDGLSPSIAIDQKTSTRNPRSTVGTITEIYDYLRVLYARIGTLYCLESGEEVKKWTVPQIVREINKSNDGARLHLLAPLHPKNVKDAKILISQYLSLGFSRFRIDGNVEVLEDNNIKKCTTLDVVIDRLLIKPDGDKRLTDSIEHALKVGGGDLVALIDDKEFFYSENNMAPSSTRIYPDLEPRLFSFNSPLGACSRCNGLGETKTFDEDRVVFDDSLSILDGAITPLTKKNTFLLRMVESVAKTEKVNLKKTSLRDLSDDFKTLLFYGGEQPYVFSFESENSIFKFTKPFPGILNWLDKKYTETGSEKVRTSLEEFMNIKLCPSCKGQRLGEVALATKIEDKNIMDICSMSISEANKFIASIKLAGEKKEISAKLMQEIKSRLSFLLDVGLDYLTLNRSAATLSGGEAQRIRLATQIGSALSGVLYVLDEPSIGLHQRDNLKLIETLKALRDLGNTVLVVEHDEETMLEADYIIDMGPGAGVNGGFVVAADKKDKFLKNKDSITAAYLRGEKSIERPSKLRTAKNWLKLSGAKANNLKNVDIDIPLGVLCVVSGVSGSGKSSLIHEVLVPAIKHKLDRANKHLWYRRNHQALSGVEHIDSLIGLDQSPIGRTPHSNPATYSNLFDDIRTLYSKTPESQIRGYKPGRFSFNVKGGRCDECEGNGVKKVEMHFLPDIFITCSECKGSRYNRETLSILYKGKSIADVLNMTISEAVPFFTNHTKIHRVLATLDSVGLGYMTLGQPATTLSGGEAQRLKLSRELAKRTKGHCIYVLDEPTTGLHFEDIKLLLAAINDLVNQGHSVIVIEHNLDVIKSADWVIDLGPEGGINGGTIIGSGTPDEVSKIKKSHTGLFLKKVLRS